MVASAPEADRHRMAIIISSILNRFGGKSIVLRAHDGLAW
jgi:hypothetical protein